MIYLIKLIDIKKNDFSGDSNMDRWYDTVMHMSNNMNFLNAVECVLKQKLVVGMMQQHESTQEPTIN